MLQKDKTFNHYNDLLAIFTKVHPLDRTRMSAGAQAAATATSKYSADERRKAKKVYQARLKSINKTINKRETSGTLINLYVRLLRLIDETAIQSWNTTNLSDKVAQLNTILSSIQAEDAAFNASIVRNEIMRYYYAQAGTFTQVLHNQNNIDPYSMGNYVYPLFISHNGYVQEQLQGMYGIYVSSILRLTNQDPNLLFPSFNVIKDPQLQQRMMTEAFTGGDSTDHNLLFVETGFGNVATDNTSTLSFSFQNEQLTGSKSVPSIIKSITGPLTGPALDVTLATMSGQLYAPGFDTTTSYIGQAFDKVFQGKDFFGLGANINTVYLPKINAGYTKYPAIDLYVKITKIAYSDAYVEIYPMYEWLRLNFGVLATGAFVHPVIIYSKDLSNRMINSLLEFNDNGVNKTLPQQATEAAGAAKDVDPNVALEIYFVALPTKVSIQVSDFDYTDRTRAENSKIYDVLNNTIDNPKTKFYKRIDVTMNFTMAVPYAARANFDIIGRFLRAGINTIADKLSK